MPSIPCRVAGMNVRGVWALLALLGLTAAAAVHAADAPADPFAELKFRHIGPVGNRAPAVTGVPGDPLTYYVGAASGGIFKTTDGGATWAPIFDDTPAFSIGSLAVAPSDPNVVWAGTGETFIRANISIGDGIYRSLDAGRTWENRGLEKSGRIGRIVIDPRDPDVVFAAALGHTFGPQPERGVYRTRDGGATWEQVLFVDENTGAIDIVMDPNNPRILFAGMWQIKVWTAGRESGGPGSGLYTSRDGGDTWTQLLGHGLPEAPWGKIGLAMSAADSNRVYALIETNSNRDFAPLEDFAGVLWRSDDGGRSWSMVNADNNLAQRPLYYTRASAAPDNANEITFMAVQQSISYDGGVSIERQNSGWDHHDIWIDPLDGNRRITGHDGGVSITVNRGKSWFRPQLPIAQMYHVATDNRIPYNVYGNRQDGPTAMGPSNTLTGGDIPVGAWREVGGCEVGFTVPDPEDANLVWAGCYDGILDLYDQRTGQARDVSVWPQAVESWAAADLKYRIQWDAPLAISPHDHTTVYYGSQYVHRTRDQGHSWEVISPDLTTADPALMRRTGGLTLDDAGPTIAPVVFSIAESPLEPGVIWAGTNDGQVQVTRDAGATWTNVTAALGGLPPLGTVSNIEPSRHAAGVAYLTVDRHQEADTASYVYKTADYGKSWKSLRGDLPQGTFSYAYCVREDPEVAGLLFLGTENELWVSFDDGAHWRALGAGLPPAPVHWLEIQPQFNDLVVATYGRGFWILDDMTPLRRWAEVEAAGRAALFAPRPAYRFQERTAPWSEYQNAAAGTNPEYGALLHYYLPEEVEDGVALVIHDAGGETVRRVEDLEQAAGVHRSVWDLLQERTTEVKLRTKPEEAGLLDLPGSGWRKLTDGGRFSIFSPPGTYTVELEVGGKVLASVALTLLKDPGSAGTEEDIASQMPVLRDLRALIETSSEMVNTSEWARRQLYDLRAALEDLRGAKSATAEEAAQGAEPVAEGEEEEAPAPAAREGEAQAKGEGAGAEGTDLLAAIDALDGKLKALEGLFFDLRLPGAYQDSLRWKRLLNAQLTRLASRISSSDLPPTAAQLEFYAEVKGEVEAAQGTWGRLRDEEIPALNALVAAEGVGAVVLPTVVEEAP
jgi:photosystem II stability/assembly factor-like uncharacterized protein